MLNWRGDRVKAQVQAASLAAVEETNAVAAAEASALWPVDTGLSREAIEVLEPAHVDAGIVTGTWGGRELPPSAEYSESSRSRIFFQEVGSEGRPGLNILRNSADRANADLAARVRRGIR